ncbi:hypothetical protein GUJ93_ZPchr0014g47137 [Zizania palustris]|uniref:Uncharacterized protein n=1 Tax=Zizania palustris TaxID=103762 RepID=A0A8J5TB55_ZIZPA|nr:hypothetical protein GUJ93_ZPchr0014g47137 [Zizania palustris]
MATMSRRWALRRAGGGRRIRRETSAVGSRRWVTAAAKDRRCREQEVGDDGRRWVASGRDQPHLHRKIEPSMERRFFLSPRGSTEIGLQKPVEILAHPTSKRSPLPDGIQSPRLYFPQGLGQNPYWD